jgi:hypothetical protein
VLSMRRWWGKGADLEAVADELNSRLGPRAKPDALWTAQRVQTFLTGTRRRIKRDGARGPPGTVDLEDDNYWVVHKPNRDYEGIPKTEQVIIYDGRGRRQ